MALNTVRTLARARAVTVKQIPGEIQSLFGAESYPIPGVTGYDSILWSTMLTAHNPNPEIMCSRLPPIM